MTYLFCTSIDIFSVGMSFYSVIKDRSTCKTKCHAGIYHLVKMLILFTKKLYITLSCENESKHISFDIQHCDTLYFTVDYL